MIPLKIKLHNFRVLADTELNLSAISLASVVAQNGSGKSSLLTLAPLFALFGKYPDGSIDDLIRTGQQNMSVTFEFKHNNEIYQIIRTRKLGKKSTCELQRKTSTGWESLTGTTIKETDAKIQQLLNLDADTFLTSSLIMQNDVANFSRKLPSERKTILASILGLDIYNTLQGKAKEQVKALEIKFETSKQELVNLEEKLKTLPEVEVKLSEVRQSLVLTARNIRDKENEIATIQAEIKNLEAKQQESKQIEKQIDELMQEIGGKQTEASKLEAKIIEAKTILESEPEVIAAVKKLEEIKAQIPALEAKKTRLRELKSEETKLSKDEMALVDEQTRIAKRITALMIDLRQKDELRIASEDYRIGLEGLKGFDIKAEQHQALTAKLNIAETDLLRASTSLDTLLNEYGQLEKKIAILQNSGCIDPERASCKFLLDAQEAHEKMLVLKERIEDARVKLNPLYEQKQALEDEIHKLDYNSELHASVKKITESLRQKSELYTSLSGKEELLQSIQQQHKQLDERIGALNDQVLAMQRETKTLQAETENMPILKARIPTLEKYATQKDKLPEAKAVIQSTKEQIAKLENEIKAKNKQRIELQEQYLNLKNELHETLAVHQNKLGIYQAELKELQQGQNRLFALQGALNNQLESLHQEKQKHANISEILAPQAKELVRWQTLVKAFGKNGIPALIIENAIPELERISNEILGEMSGGANTLQFITQRDAKSKNSMIETLDILVSDWAGTRPFESYSGGEQTRISLAIRFALSELLANRAGSKIEFIVGDEILSDQSPEFREMTIQSIKSLANRFKKILIISHIPEVQGAFDQRITLGEGGKVNVQFSY